MSRRYGENVVRRKKLKVLSRDNILFGKAFIDSERVPMEMLPPSEFVTGWMTVVKITSLNKCVSLHSRINIGVKACVFGEQGSPGSVVFLHRPCLDILLYQGNCIIYAFAYFYTFLNKIVVWHCDDPFNYTPKAEKRIYYTVKRFFSLGSVFTCLEKSKETTNIPFKTLGFE